MRSRLLGLATGIGVVGFGLYTFWKRSSLSYTVDAAYSLTGPVIDMSKSETDFPIISRSEVERHASRETGVWVTYKGSVYDITDFVDSHPGGSEKIMLAAGKDIGPFWSVYQVHLSVNAAKELLADMQIGRLSEKERAAREEADSSSSDAYSGDPWSDRSSLLTVNSTKPFDAESPLGLLADNMYTPNAIFFVRNHLPVPQVDVKTYKLGIEGEGLESFQLSLEELKSKFPEHTISATIQCAGNRRSEMSKVKTIRGLRSGQAAISNAKWKGVRLRDLLLYAGYKPDSGVRHIEFMGLDKDMTGSICVRIHTVQCCEQQQI
jgi:sulfite oxidase